MPLRTLSISKTSDVAKIWEEAERRLGASRANFSLVRSGSRYLQSEGILESSEQLFEIRWRGRGGGPGIEGEVKDPRAGFLPEMVKIQYRLRKEGPIMTIWMPLESEIGYVKRELQKRHPDSHIEKLYQGGAELADEDPIFDWRTATGTRFQVTINLDDELREDEGRDSGSGSSLQLEPENSSSEETSMVPELAVDDSEEEWEEEEAEEDESFKYAPSLKPLEEEIQERIDFPLPGIMYVYDRWNRFGVPFSKDWREQVKRFFNLKSDIWMPTVWAEGEFDLIVEGAEADSSLVQKDQEAPQSEVEEPAVPGQEEIQLEAPGLVTVYFGTASARSTNNPYWRQMVARQLNIEGFHWYTREGLLNWRAGEFHAIVCMEVVREGRTNYVETDGNDIKQAIMRHLEIPSSGWSLWKDGRRVEEKFWKVDRYVWKSDEESIEITIDDQEVALRNREELREWLRTEYPGESIVKLSAEGKSVSFRKIQRGGQYWTVSEEDDQPWKCWIDQKELWLNYRPSYMELSVILKVARLWDVDAELWVLIEEILEEGRYLTNPVLRVDTRPSYLRPNYRRPECKVCFVKGAEEREWDTGIESLLSEISDWMGYTVHPGRFTDVESGEILTWRALK
jgi:hypothetical protein